MQGPINKEPEEKLDPSNKQNQTTTSGIRRLYVVDSYSTTTNLIVVLVDLCLNNAINNKNAKITDNNKNNNLKLLNSIRDNSLISLIVLFLLNIFYLFMCFNLNKFLANLFMFFVYFKCYIFYFLVVLFVFLMLKLKYLSIRNVKFNLRYFRIERFTSS